MAVAIRDEMKTRGATLVAEGGGDMLAGCTGRGEWRAILSVLASAGAAQMLAC